MKAAVLTGINQIEIREYPVPKIEKGSDILLKVSAVGICGSDIHYYKTGRIGDQIIKYPFRIGHEFVATVSEVGNKVSNVKPGDLVAIDPAISCGVCDQCLSGRAHTCRKLVFLGNPDEHEGCLSEFIVMPENCCYKIPNSMSVEQGVLIEPLSIANYAIKFIKDIKADTIGILGAGPIGLSILLNTRLINPDKVYVTDKLDYRKENAKSLGAYWSGNPDKIDVVHELSNIEPMLLDVVFECCGQQDAINQAIQILKPGGHLVIVGIPEVDEIVLDIHNIRRKEITIHNVRRQNDCMSTTIEFVAKNSDVTKLITHKFTFEEVKKAFDLVANYENGVIKAVINF